MEICVIRTVLMLRSRRKNMIIFLAAVRYA